MKKTTNPEPTKARLVLTAETLRHISGGYGETLNGCIKSYSGSGGGGGGGGGGGTIK